MKTRTRLALGLFVIAVVLLVPLALAISSLRRVHRATVDIRDREFAASLLLGRMRGAADDLRSAELSLLFVPGVAARDTMAARITHLSEMADTLNRFGLGVAAQGVRQAINQVLSVAPKEYQFALAGNGRAADSLSGRYVAPAIAAIERVIQNAEAPLRQRTRDRVQETTQLMADAERASALGLMVAALLALAIAYLLWRSISRPVSDLETGMAAVADGNFGYRLEVSPDRPDEFGRLARSFQSMAAQLAQLDRLKAEFISVASHELKTPLNVLLGYIQLIDEGVYGPVTPKQRDVLRTLDVQTRGLARLVHQLLDVSRFEAGGGKIFPRPIAFGRFLRELEATFRVLSLQRAIDFRLEVSEELPEQVVWDADRMNEVLGNLLSNAFKFTERGGKISLHVEAVNGSVHITVNDTGAGIPSSQLPHIFEKFYQADNQRRASVGGTGLGLAIAKQIVVAHGGSISAESTLGVGTTFSVIMPVQAGRSAVVPTREIAVGELV